MSWRERIPPEDLALARLAGYGARMGFAQRPALLIVDVTFGYLGDPGDDLHESVKKYRNSCGARGWAALPVIRRLLEAARAASVPAVYTTPTPGYRAEVGRWADKISRMEERPAGVDIYAIPQEIAPLQGEIVIRKRKPSGFFATPLASHLVALERDGVAICGCTTAGCVRATATDAFSYDFRVAVVEDAVFDRSEFSHAATLFDLDMRYADVAQADDVIAHFESLRSRTT